LTFYSENLSFLDDALKTMLEKLPISNNVNFNIESARNGELNLIVNGINLYSRYNPSKDVQQFTNAQLAEDVENYIIFGFGLGYSVRELIEIDNKKIYVFENNLYLLKYVLERIDCTPILSHDHVKIITDFKNLNLTKSKMIIPTSWINILDDGPLKEKIINFSILKTGQMNNGEVMNQNFIENQKIESFTLSPIINKFENFKAVLVSAGPSLDETVQFIKELKNNSFILCVGAAYQTLLKNNINPDAVIIIEPVKGVIKQLENASIKMPFFFLSTVNYEIPKIIVGTKIQLYQKGYPLAEEYAEEHEIPLVDSGGSVATTGFDLLLRMGFKEILLFGQDLVYINNKSHSSYSSSNNNFSGIVTTNMVIANNGKMMPTSNSWNIFRKFFEEKIENYPYVKVLNTSYQGAKIKGSEFINLENYHIKQLQFDFIEHINSILRLTK
jgi:hypothetical protein